MVEFCVPTNYSNTYIDKLFQLNQIHSDKVTEVFGSFKTSFVGHARESITVQAVTKKELAKHVKYAHSKGIAFNLLLNAIYTPDLESTKKGRTRLEGLCTYIKKTNFDSVTLASPFLMHYFTRNHPEIKIKISCGTEAYSIASIRKYNEFNPKVIVWNRKLNRALPLLGSVPEELKNKIELVVNSRCIHQCPYSINHLLASGYSSKSTNAAGNLSYPFYSICCTLTALSSPIELIKSPWIRPEDITQYEKLGITKFKLDGRGKSEDKLIDIIRAYLSRNYDGNLIDLVGNSHLREARYFLDNKKLGGFIKNFENELCISKDCNSCGVCAHYAKFVQVDASRLNEIKHKFEQFKECLLTNASLLDFKRDKKDWENFSARGYVGSPLKIMEKYYSRCENE